MLEGALEDDAGSADCELSDSDTEEDSDDREESDTCPEAELSESSDPDSVCPQAEKDVTRMTAAANEKIRYSFCFIHLSP